MDGDSDIQLNLHTGPAGNQNYRNKDEKQTKIQRIKAKKLKRRQELEKINDITVKRAKTVAKSPEKSDDAQSKEPKKIQKEKASPHHKFSKSSQIISSLFKNNPEIPEVKCATVERVKEVVFSSEKFAEVPELHPFMARNLDEKMDHITTMTTVQKRTIPEVLSGHDVMVKSQTGSGKTLAYAVPVVQTLQDMKPKLQRSDGVHAIVLVPTRELALQSFETFEKLLRPFTWVVPGCIMGGEQRKKEKARLRKGINILISTPGRLLDHIQNTESLSLSRIKYLIIDEADRLLDMGFEKDVSSIVHAITEKQQASRQTILLSATLSSGVEKLAGMSLTKPKRIDVTTDNATGAKAEIKSDAETESVFAIPDSLKQYFLLVPDKLKLVALTSFILEKCKYSNKGSKMIVFFATQDMVEYHHSLLSSTVCKNEDDDEGDSDIDLFTLHGEMSQKDRTKMFQDFLETPTGVLLCTDVAARGLDLHNVNWIVQYNCPGTPSDYIHRIGRTARIGTKGQAVLLLTPSEVQYIKILNEHKLSLVEMQLDDVLKTSMLYIRDNPPKNTDRNNIPHTVQESATALQMVFESAIYSNKTLQDLATKAYTSYVRAYATYPVNVKHIFHIKTLHLGHVAKSFGLREAPTKMGSFVGKRGKSFKKSKQKDKHSGKFSGPKKKRRLDMISEFSSGLS
ncbi:unnamed protein product, partial [Owenia fusiformis]